MIGSALGVGPAQAATFVVDDTGDGGDMSPGNGVCRAPGPPPNCTFRASIEEANALAGTDTITFNIAGAGVHTISPVTPLPLITTPVTIDGTTQSGYVAGGLHPIELNGATPGGIGLDVGPGGTATIIGLTINRFSTAIRFNVTSGNVVAGNYLGTDPTGTLAGPGNGVGVYIGSNNNQIDGTTAAGRNVISANTVDGIQIDGAGGAGSSNVVKGNYIGLNAAGTAGLGNAGQGVSIFNGADNNTIGGTAPGAGNVISANNHGIAINSAGTTGNLVQGNRIGTDWTGTFAIGNTGRGVTFDQGSSDNGVGGTAAGAGNTIAHNGSNAVWMGGVPTVRNAILGNAIFANGGLGIDLSANSVDINDTGDGDTGPNTFQNHPVLSAAMTNGTGSVTFAGSLNSAASTTYRIEFFASSVIDPTGFGEGQRYLGFANVTTDAVGNAIFGATLAVSLTAGEYVTATATDPSNNTSEFSGAVQVGGSLVVTTTADTTDGNTASVSNLIATPGADGRISLREAIQAANNTAGTDTIRFGIPLTDANHVYYRDDAIAGSLTSIQVTTLADLSTPSSPTITDYDADYPAGQARSWYRIQLASALPAITGTVVLDSTTQPLSIVGTGPVIELDGSSGSGNTLDLQAGSSGSTIRGLVINRAPGNAILLRSSNNVIAANYLGIDPAGKLASGNQVGVYIQTGNNRIGGTTAPERNIISGNTFDGIRIDGAGATNNLVQGNYIGVEVTGTTSLGNSVRGVAILGGAANNTVGGTGAGAGNRIAFNGGRGVSLQVIAGTGNAILANQIYSNASLGIDLNQDGVSANDALDLDTGPNDFLNFPVITSVVPSGGTLTVNFQLDVPAGSYRIEFFKNPSGADPSTFGEGEVFASSRNVTHFGGGPVLFTHSFAGSIGDVITATTTACTDGATCAAFGSTSEFGKALTAVTATAVELMSFTAVDRDKAVDLAWQTGSELDNLGFYLYRSRSASGPFERITASLIPGLGTSVLGASYTYRDVGLMNGAAYYYVLEDVETTGQTKRHGPVSATPQAGAAPPSDEGEPSGDSARITYGDPAQVSLRVVERGAAGAVLELVTGGFYAEPLVDGTVRLSVPGFETLDQPGYPILPVERTMLEARVGRQVRIASVTPSDVVAFSSLRPEDAGAPEMSVLRDGTLQAGRRKAARALWRGAWPEAAARVVSVAFQGETKKALVELVPLRWDEDSGKLLLARRLLVRVVFSGREGQEVGQGAQGRRPPKPSRSAQGVAARLVTREAGLHAVGFDQLFPARRRPVSTSELSLTRLGEAVSYFVSPDSQRFAPGSTLYFVSPGSDANPYGTEAVFELSLGQAGVLMGVGSAAPSGATLGETSVERLFETNRYYTSSLLEAPDLWLWDYLRSGDRKSFPFTLSQLAPAGGPIGITIDLQGASDYPASPDHHFRASLNGMLLGETSWDGKRPQSLSAEVPWGVLREGGNLLELESVNDTGAYSLVYFDRFRLRYAHALSAEAGVFAGSFGQSGSASVAGLATGAVLLDTTTASPRWLTGALAGSSGVSFHVEAGHQYLAISPEALLRPEIRLASPGTLRSTSNQADYVVIAPRSFLGETEPLLQQRRAQGLSAMAVAVEEVFDEFGYGEARPEAVRDFLAYAFHNWNTPSLRYVLLLGDATYDPKNYTGYGSLNLVPTPIIRTSFLWTASDPMLGAVNGEDALPDVALGRLSASSVEEAHALVQKVLAWESSGASLEGEAVLVADNPDRAGDFEADAEEIARTLLASRPTEKIFLSRLGTASTRAAIHSAFDHGVSLVSYIGHGSIMLWASENVFDTRDVPLLVSQSQQPLVLAMNCLNGFFHLPSQNTLGEQMVKAEGKGAIAAFTASGLSLDDSAHVYHKAVLREIVSGRHARLGDAILAAQGAYADSGAFGELLAVYHLLGDPALKIR